MSNITIIGSGSFGCALAYVLNKKNNVKIWSYKKEEADLINKNHKCMFLNDFILDEAIKCYTSYEDALDQSDYIVLASPSNAIREICRNIKPYIGNKQIILASKGMENDKLLSQVIKEELNIDCSIISGPSHAEQIIKNIPTFIEYSGKKDIKDIFECNEFHLLFNPDKVGMQIGSSLKNVITLAVGLLEGLKYESNTISYIITEGLKEIKEIGIHMGAKEATFYSLSGLGDLLTTAYSLDSRNKRAGLLLAKGKTIEEIKNEIGMTIEGLDALNNACYLIKKYKLNCSLIINLYEVIYNNKNINELLNF